ncbi:FtsX-like permease family protein [Chitinophaga sp. XS-30]|uniref:ABC transporter permease n=1 Tax=Chitinophaga sp. XS-30 TaxID=2604421 RepID=UPI0011DD5C1C|nr:FtsX-like permease family protein [Chitinophaga sp. XS-30]QEH41504.1 ABC transporter permease [Chitinophaga sp. XS-30]
MNGKLILDIAGSLLMARWRQTLVAAVGVMFGITMFIALLGFMNGLNDLLDGLVLNRTPHIRLYSEIKPNPLQPVRLAQAYNGYHHFIHSVKSVNSRDEIYNSGAIMQAIRGDRRVAGMAPRITARVFFTDGPIDITGIVNGVDALAENELFHFGDYVVAGNLADIDNIANSIILGTGLAEKLQVETGDIVQVTTAQGRSFPLKVAGYFQSGLQEFDNMQSYASIATAQKLLGKTSNYITDIQVKLNDINEAPAIAKEYRELFQTDAEDIQTANSQFETGSFIRSLISYAVGITLLIVAGFGIYNILNMMIYEKMDAIAIMKATGFAGRDVQRIFLLVALSIGLSGGVAGLLFGYLVSMAIDSVPFETAALPTITTYPVNYDMIYYVIGLTFSLITTFLAGWFPARKASKIDPVIIIRGK